jgi:hypothetical protein
MFFKSKSLLETIAYATLLRKQGYTVRLKRVGIFKADGWKIVKA